MIVFFIVVLIVQLVYIALLRRGFQSARRTYELLRTEAANVLPPISVIVAARNEEENLPALLESLTRQTHPEYEIVIVDDASEDASRSIIQEWQADHPNLRLVMVDDPIEPRKKHALSLGIDAARYETLAFTDADCAPSSEWLEDGARMLAADPQRLLLVGYSPFRKAAGLLNRFSRYETLVTGQMTAAAIGLGRPYMAVGRNMFYSKELFDRTGGFSSTLQSLSGDDDLFVQQVYARNSGRVVQLFGDETYVPTDAPRTFIQWLRQKMRHTSAGRFYPRNAQLHLTIYHATSILLCLAPFFIGWIGAAFLAARFLAHGLSLSQAAKNFGERSLMPSYPVLEILYIVYNMVVAPAGLVRKPVRW